MEPDDEIFSYLPLSLPPNLPSSDDDSSHASNGIVELDVDDEERDESSDPPPFHYTQRTSEAASALIDLFGTNTIESAARDCVLEHPIEGTTTTCNTIESAARDCVAFPCTTIESVAQDCGAPDSSSSTTTVAPTSSSTSRCTTIESSARDCGAPNVIAPTPLNKYKRKSTAIESSARDCGVRNPYKKNRTRSEGFAFSLLQCNLSNGLSEQEKERIRNATCNKKQYEDSSSSLIARFFETIKEFGGPDAQYLLEVVPGGIRNRRAFFMETRGERTDAKHAIINYCLTLCAIKWRN